ncbi:MAG TPA: FAD-binding oxidoreductase [Candidatus Limnocylindrales bacterium]|nr:FAD-binding oxidoreductase [Candidatus Limnocylindrales bacterium]
MQQATTSMSVPELSSAVRGRVFGPEDPDYDAARTVLVPIAAERRPAAVVRVADAADVVAVVNYARDHGLELAVRSGGHSAAGHSTVDGGIVIDLRDMKKLEIDAANRTAWAETGLTAIEYTTATVEHGLATGFGDTGSVGIGGITLGGGVGYLGRLHGLTIDNVLAAEIVTADGRLRRIDAEHEPDLFWAIRGGGGNFGVVTRFLYRLADVSQFTGGMIVLPGTPEVIEAFVRLADAAPDELSTIANVMSAPPMPFLPEEAVGSIVLMGMLAYTGDPESAERVLAPFRELATPLADFVAANPYTTMYPPDDPDYHPTAESRTMFIDHVDRPTAETIVEHLNAIEAPIRVAQLRVLGGAMSRVPADATAYAHRSGRIMVNVAAFYEGEDDRALKVAWVSGFSDALYQGDDAAYVNFVGDEGEARIHAAYPGATWDRLAAVKARYDPDNLFHMNQNVSPAAG